MGVLELRTELQKMIEQENDVDILKALRTILEKTTLDPVLKVKLTTRALKSEEDIKAGRLLNKEQMIKRTNNHLGQ